MSRIHQQYKSSDEPIPGYRLVRFLGKGNFGEVWMAAAPGKKKVALKIIDLRGREGLQESKAIERIKDINHAHLVSIFAYWLIDEDGRVIDDQSISQLSLGGSASKESSHPVGGTMYLDSPLEKLRPIELIVAMSLGSKNLSDLLEECEKEGKCGIPVEALLDYMEDAAKGLDYLNSPVHDLGKGPMSIIHGDIKPQNLLIVGNSLQICDFGLARGIDDLRATATAMGSFAYAAPELLEGHPHVRSDQYCLAVSYMELRTGNLPLFGATNLLKVAELHRDSKLDFSGLGPEEAKVIRKSTHRDPAQRWESCRRMVRELRAAVEADCGAALPSSARRGSVTSTRTNAASDTTPSSKLPSRGARRFLLAMVIVLLVVALAAGGWWGRDRFKPLLAELTKRFAKVEPPKPVVEDTGKPEVAEDTHKPPVTDLATKPPVPVPAEKPIPVAALLAEVREAFINGQFATARAKLSAARDSLIAAPDASLLQQARTWEAAVAFADPAATPSEREAALEPVKELLGGDRAWDGASDAAPQLALAYALWLPGRNSAGGASDEQLAFALQAVRRARGTKCDPKTQAALAACCAKLWQQRIDRYLRAGEPPPPTREEFREFENDWKSLDAAARSGADLPRLNAWQGECRRCFEPDAPLDAAAILGPLPPDPEPYVRYVRLLLNGTETSDPRAIIDELTGLFAGASSGDRSDAVLRVPSRLKRIVGWAAAAARSVRTGHAPRPLLANPFGDAGDAGRCYELLKSMRDVMAAVPSAERKWTPDAERELRLDLALAAVFQATPDLATARDISSAWLDGSAGSAAVAPANAPADAELAWYAAVRSRLPESAAAAAGPDDSGLMTSSLALIRSLTADFQAEHEKIDAKSAKVIYSKFLQPVLERTGTLAASEPQGKLRGELSDFYFSVYEFVAKNRARPVSDQPGWIEAVRDSAIKLREDPSAVGKSHGPYVPVADVALRRLYRDRAEFALAGGNANLDCTVADAAGAGARDLLIDALVRRAPQRNSRESLIEDVDAAIEEGKTGKTAYGLAALSAAYVLRANYDNHPAYLREARNRDLEAASVSMKRADKMASTAPGTPRTADSELRDYLYHLAAARAFEDLASLADVEPAVNINLAIREFSKAAKANPLSPWPLCGQGRCYYQALAEMYLRPDVLQKRDGGSFQDKFQVMDESEQALRDARDKDPRAVEAADYLARLYQFRAAAYLGRSQDDSGGADSLAKAKSAAAQADEQCKSAWDLARQEKLFNWDVHAVRWAMSPWSDVRFDIDKEHGAQRRRDEVLARLDVLEKSPPPPGRQKELQSAAALIRGHVAQMNGKYEIALKTYSEALPKDLAAVREEDTALLLARAACRLRIATKGMSPAAGPISPTKEESEQAEQAVKDAAAGGKVAGSINERVIAAEQSLRAHVFLYFAAPTPIVRIGMYARGLDVVKNLRQLAPRHPHEYDWCVTWARVAWAQVQYGSSESRERMKNYSDAVDWASRAVEACPRKPLRDELLRTLLKPCLEAAIKFADEQLGRTPPPKPPFSTNLETKREEWKKMARLP